MVVLGLGGVVLVIVSLTLNSTVRVTTLQTQRGSIQGRLQTIAAELEVVLQRSCNAGVAWLPPASPGGKAVLTVHPHQTACITTLPQWELTYRCYVWDGTAKQLRLVESPPGPPALTAPTPDRPQIPPPAELTLLATTPLGRARLLSKDVSNFTYSQEAGPLVKLVVEIEGNVPNSASVEKFRVERLIHLRNRI